MKKYLKSLEHNYSSEVAKKVYDMYQYTPSLFYAIEDNIESKHYNLATSLPILVEKEQSNNTPALLKTCNGTQKIESLTHLNQEVILENFIIQNLDRLKTQLNNLKKLKIKSHNKYVIAISFNGIYDYELEKLFLSKLNFYDINLANIDLKKYFSTQTKHSKKTLNVALLHNYEHITEKYFDDITSEFNTHQFFLNLSKFENDGIDTVYWLNFNTISHNQYTHISYNRYRTSDDILIHKNKINFSKKTKKFEEFFIFQNNVFLSSQTTNQLDKKSLIFYNNTLEIENETQAKIHFYEDILNYHLENTDIHYNQELIISFNSYLNYLTQYHTLLNEPLKDTKHFKHNIYTILNKDATLNFNYLSQNQNNEQTDIYFDLTHRFENTHSKTYFQSINQGKNIFNINTTLAKKAKNASTHQKTHNLLLHKDAQSISQPNLHVFNPDVIATHGSATSKFDEYNRVYLKSRGLNDSKIKELLITSTIKTTFAKFIEEVNQYEQGILFKFLGIDYEYI